MPNFHYVAKDKTGKTHRGTAEAADENALVSQMREAGYWLVQAVVEQDKKSVDERDKKSVDERDKKSVDERDKKSVDERDKKSVDERDKKSVVQGQPLHTETDAASRRDRQVAFITIGLVIVGIIRWLWTTLQ